MRSIQKASLGLVAAGLIVTVAAVDVIEATTVPPSDPTATTTTTTLPILPSPSDAPTDNEAEPQTYHGRIQIPALEVDAPFIEGIRLSTLDSGPGHWPGTAMPGQLGNVVVAGHRTSHDAHFRNLDQLVPGDQVIFDLDESAGLPTATVPDPDPFTGRYVYEVAYVEIVGPEAMWIVSQDYRHSATLFACHPPGSVSQRIVAHLDLVDPAPTPADPPRPTTTTTTTTVSG